MSSATLIASLYVFVLAAFLGYQVISRVPPLLHTPLMSATNAISGISLVGSIVIAGGRSEEHTSELQSRSDLVCRLLLEKKKKKNYNQYTQTKNKKTSKYS